MSEIPKAYEPQSVEDKWYDFWLKHGCFTADPARVSVKRPAYSIVIPPPNVTGMLHMGHVLNNTIQDILARKARMDGKEVLWLPGMDHAGIATEGMVSKQIWKEEKKTKREIGREEFIKRVWTWKEKHGGIIIAQLKKLGCSCDWTRERFTMDPEYVRNVQSVFVDLYKKGLIYRGKRMVNWCPATQTALSDEEVEMKPQKGFMYHFKVEVAEVVGQASRLSQTSKDLDGDRRDACPTQDGIRSTGIWLTIATTRPETIPGDTAVAVNPKDPRYAHLIGKHIVRPLPPELPSEQKFIPIIGDEHVDFEFGTGVLKVTPAHDKADFDIGQRHKLPLLDIMNPDATMNELAGADLKGLDRFKARKVAVEKLTELGALVEEKPYENNVGFSQRADVPIEPRLSEQWFLKYPAVPQSKACILQEGQPTINPERPITVIQSTGREFIGTNVRTLRKAARDYARKHGFIGRQFKNEDSGIQMRIGRQSLTHAFSNLGVANIRAVAVLPELIRTAVWISSEPHDPPNPMFKQVHRLAAALSLAGELHRVLITAKEFRDGTILYDHRAKKITFGGKSLEAHLPKEKLDTQPAPNAGTKLGDLLENVNLPAKMRFHPQRWAKVYNHWLANIQDWCISRQLWWGHRIPVWYNARWRAAETKVLKVVHQDWNTISGNNAKEMRDNAWRYAREHGFINSDFPNLDAGFDITVQQSSLEHAFSNRGLANLKLVPALPSLLRHAVHVATVPHTPPAREVLCVHLFYAALQLGRAFFRVKFTVKEFRSRLRLYDHQTVEVKKMEADGKYPPEEASVAGSFAPWPASVSEIKMAELISGVNLDFASLRCQVESPGEGWEQDPDVLDTWFSSWLWPFATMGWPEQTPTLKAFYPTTDLVTAPDIIFFWVARMIMAGYEFMGDLPFRNVYFTGLIRDKLGRKMSKTLGNSPDPLELIAKYGADALRFGTMRGAPLGQDVLFDEKDVELGRNFCNKLWNACRYRQLVGQASRLAPTESGVPTENETGATPVLRDEVQGEINPALLTSDDKWILLKLDQAIREVSTALTEYKFNEATTTLYRFFWSEYCDWYLEASKAVFAGRSRGNETQTASDESQRLLPSSPTKNEEARRANALAVIDFVLSHTLRLLHPFLPFITEELWHGMGYAQDMPENQGGKTIMNAPWPKPFDGDFRDHYALDDCYLEFAQAKYDLVSEGRNLRRIANIPGSKKVRFVFKPVNPVRPHDAEVIRILLNAEALEIVEEYQPKKGTPTAHTPMGDLFLPLEGLVDMAAEIARLTKEVEKYEAEIVKVAQKLANPNFTQKVPPQVLQEHQQRLAEWQAKLEHTKAALDGLTG